MTIEIANRLIELRKRAGLSQEELADRLGISRQAVSKWERAESGPDVDNAIMLSRLYNISLDELFGNKPEYERELDMMEPDEAEPAPDEAAEASADDAENAQDGAGAFDGISEAVTGLGAGLSQSISDIIHEAVSSAKEAAAEAKRIKDEAEEDAARRESSIPADAETIGSGVYEGIRKLVCCARADLHITGAEGESCFVSCEGPEKEKSHCFVYTVGDTLHIESDDAKRKFFLGISGRTRLAIFIKLPKTQSIQAELKGGDLTVEGVRSDLLTGKTGGGDINVERGVIDSLELKTGGGNIGISSTVSQRAELITGGGDIITSEYSAASLLCAKTGGGDLNVGGSAKCVEAVTGGGDVKLSVSAEGVKAASGGGDITISCSGAKYVSAKTGGGDLAIRLPGCTGMICDVAAMGEATIDFKGTRIAAGRKLTAAAGDGYTKLELRSGGGDIAVKAE